VDIHIINLDRCKDRWQAFETLNAGSGVNFRRFSAIEGRAVAREPLAERGIITADLSYTDAALGCALSHLALWDLALETNRVVTICEDDAILNRGFGPAADALMASLPRDWDVVLWGWNFDSVLLFNMIPGVSPCLGMFDQDRMRMGVEAFQAAPLAPQPFRLINALGMVGYSVSPAGAKAIRQHCLPFRNLEVFLAGLGRALPNTGVDIVLNDLYRRLNAYVCFPPVIITQNFHTVSTIQQGY